MARRTQTYAVRLAVEGGGQVKAELVSVGQSGEQSLKRIETAGDRASGGLKGVGRQAELLRTGDLGIVLDEHLVRDAERARTEVLREHPELRGVSRLPLKESFRCLRLALRDED